LKKRHSEISARLPEACSIARGIAFNEQTVSKYFDKLEEVLMRHENFRNGSREFNLQLDETFTSTVQNRVKVISPKGAKQIHQIKAAERGTSVTSTFIIGANGTIVPPVLIFPRKKFVPAMLLGAYPGTLGLANAKGYMTKESFFEVLKHYIKWTQSSIENPSLLALDNVLSHFSSEIIKLARENGVTILTFPPHCTHRLQPLDVGFNGPFKTYYDQAVHSYYISNPASQPPSITLQVLSLQP